jgi:hypothetical protein
MRNKSEAVRIAKENVIAASMSKQIIVGVNGIQFVPRS